MSKVVVPPRLYRHNTAELSAAFIVDGIAVVQMRSNVDYQQLLGELANKCFNVITVPFAKNNCNCVVVIFDCCNKENFINCVLERLLKTFLNSYSLLLSKAPPNPLKISV